MRDRSFFELDLILFLGTIALMIISILFIYSSGISSTGINYSNEYIRQIVWAATSIIIMVVFTFFDYSRLKDLSRYLYPVLILLLLLTLVFGQVRNGARSWLSILGFGFQPSEFTKLATILFLGRYLSETKRSTRDLSRFLIAMGIAMLPCGLILLQPDMGTAMVFVPVFLVMIFLAGTRIRYILFMISAVFLAILIGMLPAWEEYILGEKIPFLQFLVGNDYIKITLVSTLLVLAVSLTGQIFLKKKYFYWISYGISIFVTAILGGMAARIVLKDYQIKRLIVFIDPGVDPQGAGWNVIQSITAVGSGGFWGKGFLKGTQSHYRFLPQQSTDFIFSIIAEEWGFVGCLAIFLIFTAILIRSLMILSSSKDSFGLYIGGGILGMIFFHFIVNIGMAMGIMPITGIPLIFLSYGGSALWTGVLGISILANIYSHRYKY